MPKNDRTVTSLLSIELNSVESEITVALTMIDHTSPAAELLRRAKDRFEKIHEDILTIQFFAGRI